MVRAAIQDTLVIGICRNSCEGRNYLLDFDLVLLRALMGTNVRIIHLGRIWNSFRIEPLSVFIVKEGHV